MPLSAKMVLSGAITHALDKAQAGREREYVLFFVRTVANDLQARRFYSSALIVRHLLKELYDAPSINDVRKKYGLGPRGQMLSGVVNSGASDRQPPSCNTGATPQQLELVEDYVNGRKS